MSNEVDLEFTATFTAPVVEAIVNAIETAVDNASERYDTTVGGNATTFGVDVYHFGVHELKKVAESNRQVFRYKLAGNLFRLFVGRYELAFHRVGSDVSEDIKQSFPNNQGAALSMLSEQLSFDSAEMPMASPSKKFILGHFASPYGGLTGVYLCIPCKQENNRISEWSVTHELWKRNDDKVTEPQPLQKLPPIEKIGELKLRTKKDPSKAKESE